MPPAGGWFARPRAAKEENNIAQKDETHHLHIELTPAQFQMLTEKAKQCGTTKRTFLIRLMEGKEVRARPSEEIKSLLFLVRL